ncbi:MAG TPA: ATP-binding protein [Actinomycetota bacterium]
MERTILPASAPVAALRRAADAKTLAMERSVSILRAAVVGVNVAVYLMFMRGHTPRPALAWTIIGVAVPYAIWSFFFRPYERYPLLRFGAATIVSDTVLITLWILGTGGPASEFWIVFAVSAVSVGMRYDLGKTIAVGAGQSAVYLSVMLWDGGLPGSSAILRPSYILIAAMAAGFVARQERATREERVLFEQIAGEHAAMLARERRTVDALREADQMKTTFISAVSHEVRTPLTAVLGFAKTLMIRRESLGPDEQAEIIHRIVASGERLERILVDLLDLNAFSNGIAQLHRGPTRLTDVVGRVLDEIETQGRPIIVDVPARLSPSLDAPKVERIVSNLIRNAIKYTPEGTPIHVRARRMATATLISVEDRGEGIPDAYKTSIFDVFQQGPRRVAHSPGTGIGLALVGRLAELHGGRAWVEDRPGGGSVFSVILPDAPPAASPEPQPDAASF